MALRVGIDVRALSGASGRRGVGSYVRGLLGGLADLAPAAGQRITLFGNGGESPEALPRSFDTVRLSRPRRAITLWDQAAWPPLLAWRRIDVFHSPFYAIPCLRPLRCRAIQTIHDLTPLRMPGAVSRHNARIFRANFGLARGADRIIVPSEATRRDVVETLRLRPDRVTVIPEACDISEAEIASADADRAGLVDRMGIGAGRRLLLHTGGHDRVKNLDGLIEAMAILGRRGGDAMLIVAGEPGPETAALAARAASLGLSGRVRMTGYLPRADLIALYRSAAALVYPSLHEGFGLPVLEAMTCGTPVVASDAGALPEVAGDAALLVPPSDAEALAAAIASLLDDPAIASRLSAAGRRRAARFSWAETARRTIDVYREAAS